MNLPTTVSTAVNAMQAAIQTQAVNSTDMPFLRLLKSGEWVYGSDDIDMEEGSQWAVNTASFGMGFQAWSSDGELEGEEIAPLTSPPILHSDLENVGAEWKPLLAAQFLCVSGADKGVSIIYKTTSKGGIKAVNTLMSEIVSHFNDDPTSEEQVPVIEFDMSFYKHKKYGKIYTPVLKVVNWLADTPEAAQAVSEPEPEPVKAEPEPASPPARKRRRRRTA